MLLARAPTYTQGDYVRIFPTPDPMKIHLYNILIQESAQLSLLGGLISVELNPLPSNDVHVCHEASLFSMSHFLILGIT